MGYWVMEGRIRKGKQIKQICIDRKVTSGDNVPDRRSKRTECDGGRKWSAGLQEQVQGKQELV